jgi:hypothetical protein
MQSNSFLLIFYGALFALAVAELAGSWKKLLRKSYWEYNAWSAAFFLVAAFNWHGMQYRMEHIGSSFFGFLLLLIPPVLFYLLVSVFTVRGDEDPKEYFLSSRPQIFLITALFVFSNVIVTYLTGDRSIQLNILRLIGVLLALVCVFSSRQWLRVLLLVYLFSGILAASFLQL